MLKGKRVFISGGNGVIGKELVDLLFKEGAILFVGDLKPRPLSWSSKIKYRQGDLNYITKEELEDFAPEYFFHLAATFERSVETYDFWYENHKHNTSLGTHLMTVLKDSPTLKKIINCSSYLIYDPKLYYFETPSQEAYSLKEDDPIYPRNLTGVAKLQHEIELRFLEGFNSEKYKSVSARIYRSYGKNSRDIVSRWIRMLLNNETLTVYKKEGLFDYVFAGDVAEGLLRLAATKEAEGVFNLATGKAQPVSRILEVLKKYFPEMKTIEKDIDIPYEGSEANMDKYEKVMGWKPQHTFADTIPHMIEFEKKFGYEDDSIKDSANVMITSISKKIPLIKSVQKAAKKLGSHVAIFGADVDENCLGQYFTDSFWKMPRISDLTLDSVIEYCNSNKIKAIIPTRDGELIYWAEQKQALKDAGISVLVSDIEAVNICLDKLLFYENCKSKDFKVIQTSMDISVIAAEKFVVKEQFGAGAKSVGINLNKEEAQKHAMKLSEPIYQPFVEGVEISIDLFVDSNNLVKGVITRTRDKVVNGESQVTTTFEDKELEKICEDVAQTLGLYGHAVLQVIKDSKGVIHIIECNCRFGGASTLSVASGLDSFYWFILEASGVDIKDYSFIRANKQIKQIRFPDDTYLFI